VIIYSPLSVPVSKKRKFILNLNNYRGCHYQILSKAKKNYLAIMTNQIIALPKMDRIKIHYTLYPATKRKTDLDNVISIHKKFLQDALVDLGRIPDDNYKIIVYSDECLGWVDRDNGRVEANITGFD
jgi:hypothetical protein